MTKAEYDELLSGYNKGSQKFREYLSDHGINPPQFYYWKKKYQSEEQSDGKFVNITTLLGNDSIGNVELRYPNGVQVHFKVFPGTKVIAELVKH